MIPLDPISGALATIHDETITAFDWLVKGVDPCVPVTFVPNPGNIGDAAINLACFNYLTERFDRVEVCAMSDMPRTECVFVGGGGNAIEPLYFNVRDLLDRLTFNYRIFMFPSSIMGYSNSLQRVAPFSRILCREPISLAYVGKQIGPQNVLLAHDAAFLLAPRLRNHFAHRIKKVRTTKCRSFRIDKESTHIETGGNDFMLVEGMWTDEAIAHDLVWDTARYLLGFEEVETDRLHCAILAAVLGRRTKLRANSYYKNAAVFDHSLSRLPNTTFLPSDQLPIEAPRNDIKIAALRHLRNIQRRLHWKNSSVFLRRSLYHD